jgi:hypothetical protein
MQPAWLLNRCLWGLNLIASALVIWRLYRLELHKVYRFFLISLALGVARSTILFPFSTNGETYLRLWALTQPLVWLTYVLVVGELYVLVLSQYSGIYSLGRWFFFGAVTLSILISGITVWPTLQTAASATGKRLLLYSYAFVERGFVTSLAIFLLLLLVLVLWFSVPLSRNLLIHCSLYTVYFIAQNVVVLYWHTGGIGSATVSSSELRLSVGIVCYCSWVYFLTRRGEDRIASLHLGRNQEQEKRLLGQLASLNATLLRTARK